MKRNRKKDNGREKDQDIDNQSTQLAEKSTKKPEWPCGPGKFVRQANGSVERLARGGLSNNAEPVGINTENEKDDV